MTYVSFCHFRTRTAPKWVFLFLFVTAAHAVGGCKSRTANNTDSDFLSINQKDQICEDLSSFMIEEDTDFEAEISREMAAIGFREQFTSIGSVINQAKAEKSRNPAAKGFTVSKIAAVIAFTNAAYSSITADAHLVGTLETQRP